MTGELVGARFLLYNFAVPDSRIRYPMSKTDDLYNPQPGKIVMYSTSWCPDCRRSRAFLTGQDIEHVEIDIGKDREAFAFIEKLTRRVRIPTIIFPDGTILVEPSDEELGKKLNAPFRA